MKSLIRKIICKEKKLCKYHKYCIAVISILSIFIIVTAFIYPGFLKTRGSTSVSFSQSNWSGSTSADPAVVATNPSDWTKYTSQSTTGVNGSNQLVLSAVNDTNTVLLLHGDGDDTSTTFTDSEGTPKSVTANGTAQIKTADSKIGGASAWFDGNSDYLSIADSADWYFGTGAFTIDFWVNFSNLQNTDFLSQNVTSGSNYYYTEFGWRTNNTIFMELYDNAYNVKLSAPFTPVVGTWYHVAIVRNGNTWYVFTSGTSRIVTLISGEYTNEWPNIASDLNIGRWAYGGGTNYFNGYLDEFRITKGLARWTADFTPSTTAYTVSSYSSSGALVSSVIDAGSTIDWGSADWTSTLDTGTSIFLQLRTSTDGVNWSCEWTGGGACAENAFDGNTGSISLSGITNGRYIQYRSLLATTDTTKTPILQNVTLSGIVYLSNPALSFTNDVEATSVVSDTITVNWDNAVVKKWKYNNNASCSSDPAGYTDGVSIPTQTDQTNNTKYICLYAENDNGGISVLASTNPINIDITGPTLSFVDIVLSGPVASNAITGDWGDAIVKKWKYNNNNSCSSDPADYTTGTSIPTQTDQANNTKYICLYSSDALGNKSVLASTNDINIDITAPVVSFTDNIESIPVLSDDITVNWGDATVTKWKYNNNTSCSSDPLGYTTGASIPTQTDQTNNTKYICLYAEDSVGNFTTLSSNNPINIDITGSTLSFTDNVASGPVLSDTITADWGDATVKKWKYNDNNSCSSDPVGYTDSTSIPTQTDETNDTKYICLYGSDALGNKSVLASTNDIDIAAEFEYINSAEGQVNINDPIINTASGDTIDFSIGLSNVSGGNIVINDTTESLLNYSGGTLAGEDITSVIIGGVTIDTQTAVMLDNTNDSITTITNTDLSGVSLEIPDATTIFGPNGWDGTIIPPTSSSLSIPPSGFRTGDINIKVGSLDNILFFNKPVTITIDKSVSNLYYQVAGSSDWNQVSICEGTFNAPTISAFPSECYVSKGGVTNIYTWHFTIFAELSYIYPPTYINPDQELIPGENIDEEIPAEKPQPHLILPDNTIGLIQISPIPEFNPEWGVGYYKDGNFGRVAWALEHRDNIYQSYIDILGRKPTAIEVNWWLTQEDDIWLIRWFFLNSEEYRNKIN